MYNPLFNTPDGQEFVGIQTDNEFGKAKKGSPEYEEWLRKYREKRGKKPEEKEEAKRKAKEELSKQGLSIFEGKSNSQINRIIKSDFIKRPDIKNFNKKGDTFTISSPRGLGDLKITLLENASSVEEMKKNSSGGVYDIEDLKCKFELGGKSWEGTVSHWENWNGEYSHSDITFFERNWKPLVKTIRAVLDEKRSK